MEWLHPQPLFNPLTAPADQLLTGWEILAGPLGLLVFVPAVPLVRWVARRAPRAAIIGSGALWILATCGPIATLALLAWIALAAWLTHGIATAALRGACAPRTGIALLWIVLAALIAPFWWHSSWGWLGWQPSRMALLHSVGLAYFFLRLISWGVDRIARRDEPARARDIAAWLLYAPCMRLGPVIRQRQFRERFDAWRPSEDVYAKRAAQRFGLFLLGGAGLALVGRFLPRIAPGAADFFAAPGDYSTAQLLSAVALIPTQIYLILWTYNELAAAISLWIGIPVDNNFDWLPRATSVREFWRRWHVTVGAWLRDYVYIPLGGARGFAPAMYAAVFGFCALWHGPSWSFVAWAATQVVALVVQRGWDRLFEATRWPRPRGSAWRLLCWLLTLCYQAATIVVFTDFEHCGLRLFGELLRRAFAVCTAGF